MLRELREELQFTCQELDLSPKLGFEIMGHFENL
jgi:hypothetical protein